MALLVPGIREVDADFVQRGVGDLVLEHFDGVVVIQAHVVRVVCGQCVEQAADAGRMHFDADQVAVRIARRGVAERLAVAEADFEHARALRPKASSKSRGVPV